MKPERNEACPCGSGKKYKKCCASSTAGRRDYITINRVVAYRGEAGRQREAFCRAYAKLKAARFVEIGHKLAQETAATGETITCGRGCVHCCSQYVVASFLECECIVHYLYQNDEALKNFLKSYSGWKQTVQNIESVFQKINSLGEKIMFGRATEEEKLAFKQECHLYAERKNACPFLCSGACSIYQVRPYVCAGYFSVSPPEWCEATHPNNHDAIHLKISLKLGADVSYFTPLKSNRLYSAPVMVHHILEGGYGALAELTGDGGLINQVLCDPEMRAALREAGAAGHI